ncbi:metal-dependent transcriptional regulator [Isobaculum melis]|uniref:Manganese transport regulator n=1 Tax=Isobaculum melis TaxID=142588 RepID=A0A1H9R1J6_9LACT|nr:metal-dependent transcriptional regulator [Isobaculum melis]SER66582.1 iron (metal) dependent repressor, DtxR family [Isobaculum melis]
MTPNKEDYLKMIFELNGTYKKVSNKEIVSGLKVSAASVSEMMTKLVKGGYITYTPYQGVQLTETGIAEASILIRKHRLWEVFLVEKLGYSWSEVHEEAELLEHVTSSTLSERLDAFLGFPEKCPHGDMIPKGTVVVDETVTYPLSALEVGQKACLYKVMDEKELLDYLIELDMHIGESFTLLSIGSYEGPIKIQKENCEIVHISQKAAQHLFVERLA